MTPRQRDLFGWPPPGDPYWNAQTLTDVALRYPGIDLTPYAAGVRSAGGSCRSERRRLRPRTGAGSRVGSPPRLTTCAGDDHRLVAARALGDAPAAGRQVVEHLRRLQAQARRSR